MLGFPVVVRVPVRARLGVRSINVQRGMGVAADESERQDHDKAANEQRSHKTRGLGVVLDYLREFVGRVIAQISVTD
jgi:hypothetical protein